jgi:hypothetical protein
VETLTVHYLARELDALWRGRRVASFAMDGKAPAVVIGAAGTATVRFDLSRPDCRALHSVRVDDRGPLDGFEITSVEAPTDDRRIVVGLVKPGKFRGSPARRAELVISMVPNARGATLVGEGGHRFGSVGKVPMGGKEARPILEASVLRAAAASGDTHGLMSGRWVGPAVARWLLDEPDRIVERYAEIAALPVARPSRCEGQLLPLPLCTDPEPAASLIEETATDASGDGDDRAAPGAKHLRAVERMRAELARAAEAPAVRAAAEVLMALGETAAVPPSLTLPDGSTFAIDARPGDAPQTVAKRLFARARAMDRARATLPARIAEMEARAARADTPDGTKQATRVPAEPRQPYKRFTSRGGLEIRVGRTARDNDALTFHASSPDDVWMHARGAAGSHVVLRWTHDDAPPAADLEEAALLAAWHSRARGSTVVPVDWTRRRYVRKPRGAKPGSVVVAQAKTVMVRPTDAALRAIRDRG